MENYCIVEALDAEELILEVNKLMKSGWGAQGGVSVCSEHLEPPDKNYNVYYQAMVRGGSATFRVDPDKVFKCALGEQFDGR